MALLLALVAFVIFIAIGFQVMVMGLLGQDPQPWLECFFTLSCSA